MEIRISEIHFSKSELTGLYLILLHFLSVFNTNIMDSRYIDVEYNTKLNVLQKENDNSSSRLWTQKRLPLRASYGVSLMSSMEKRYRDISRVYKI